MANFIGRIRHRQIAGMPSKAPKQKREQMERPTWRVMCQTIHHPGQWESWYREQCCAVGWPPPEFSMQAVGQPGDAWSKARNALRQMRPGDRIVAMLPGGRLGRLGEVVRLEVDDSDWRPVVPRSRGLPHGENGRRIIVRWDLTAGPGDPNVVVELPKGYRDNGQLAISRISSERYEHFIAFSRDPNRWVALHSKFDVERALSDYIAMHPYRLEDGMRTHPSVPVREFVVAADSRIDVVLQDRRGRAVLIECKQSGVKEADLFQLARYLDHFAARYPEWARPRGILVHGGARTVEEALYETARRLDVMLIHHELRVDFTRSSG